jgi:hypothetical protein
MSVVKVTAVMTAENPKKQTRKVCEVTKLVRSMNFPVLFSVLITAS